MPREIQKRKFYIEFPNVTRFMSEQSEAINAEYIEIVQKLETEGMLSMPYGEKLKIFLSSGSLGLAMFASFMCMEKMTMCMAYMAT